MREFGPYPSGTIAPGGGYGIGFGGIKPAARAAWVTRKTRPNRA